MKAFLAAILIGVSPAFPSLADDPDEFDAASIIAAYKAEAVGCSGIDVDGSPLDEDVQDRRCAVMRGYGLMLEDHSYCLDEYTVEWTPCPKRR